MKPFVLIPLALAAAACGRTYGADEGTPAAPVPVRVAPVEDPVDATISDRVRDAILADPTLRADSATIRVATARCSARCAARPCGSVRKSSCGPWGASCAW